MNVLLFIFIKMPPRPDSETSEDLRRRNPKESGDSGARRGLDATHVNLIDSIFSGLPAFLLDSRKADRDARTVGSDPTDLVIAGTERPESKAKPYEPPSLARQREIQGRRTEMSAFSHRVDGQGEGYFHWDYAGNVSVRKYYGPKPEDNYQVDTDGKGTKTFTYNDGTKAVLNPDDTGYVRGPQSYQHVAREQHFGPKPEDNYGITVRHTPGEDWLFQYDDGRISCVDNSGKSGFSRSARNNQRGYTETFWGPNPSDNYSLTAVRMDNGWMKKSFSNGRLIFESADGTTGYEEIKGDGNWARSERHWGPEDTDYYYKRFKADGSSVTETIPRNVDELLDIRPGTSKDFSDQVKAALNSYPRPVIEAMKEAGVNIVLVQHYIHYDPKARESQNRGQSGNPAGVSAQYDSDKKHIVLTENYEKEGYSYRSLPPATYLPHEISHVLDIDRSMVSMLDNFNTAFENDIKKLSPEDQARFGYISHQADSSHPKEYRVRREEATAELGGAAFANRVAGPYTPEDLRKAFPESYAVIAELIRTRRMLRRIEDNE